MIKAMGSNRLRKTGLAGALVAGALTGAVPMTADAAVIVDNTPVTIAYDDPELTVSVGGTDLYSIFGYTDKGQYSFSENPLNGFHDIGVQFPPYFGALSPGDVIGPSSDFADSNGPTIVSGPYPQPFPYGAISYFGFKFTPVGSSTVNYGYTKISINGDGSVITLLETAYDDSGAAITVSAAPEPLTWALMVVGFGFIGAGLRRRHQVAPTTGLATA